MKKQVSLTISGRVQGVFYRANVAEIAEALELTGWVKNDPSGTVVTLAQGEEDNLKRFIKWCWKGPDSADVTDVEEEWQEPTESFDSFEVRH